MVRLAVAVLLVLEPVKAPPPAAVFVRLKLAGALTPGALALTV